MNEFVGDYSLKSIILNSDKQEIQIKDLVSELNIYESVNSCAISADIVVTDNKNLLHSLPIRGGEKVVVTVGTNKDSYILNFLIYKIDSRVQQEKTVVYIVRLCTEDTIKNESSRYSVRHKNQFAENIVNDLLKNKLKTEKSVDVDKTVYNLNFVNPNWRIFDCCQWLARKSVPRQNVESCGFLFYEGLDGYHFKSIDNLFSRPSENSKTPFTYTPSKTSVTGNKTYRIMNYSNTDKYFDIVEELRMGNIAHYTQKIDMSQRSMTLSKSSLNSMWNNMSHLGGGKIPIDTSNKNLLNPTRIIYTPIINNLFGNSTVYDADSDKINKLIDRSIYRYNTFDYFLIDIEIAGNLGIRAGKIYDLLFPSPNSDSSVDRNRQKDSELSGTWMCHSIKTTINRTNAITIMRLCRDSFGGDVQPVSVYNSSTIDTNIFNIGSA